MREEVGEQTKRTENRLHVLGWRHHVTFCNEIEKQYWKTIDCFLFMKCVSEQKNKLTLRPLVRVYCVCG